MRRIVAVMIMVIVTLMTGAVSAEEIKVAGGGGPVENILKPVKEAFERHQV